MSLQNQGDIKCLHFFSHLIPSFALHVFTRPTLSLLQVHIGPLRPARTLDSMISVVLSRGALPPSKIRSLHFVPHVAFYNSLISFVCKARASAPLEMASICLGPLHLKVEAWLCLRASSSSVLPPTWVIFNQQQLKLNFSKEKTINKIHSIQHK